MVLVCHSFSLLLFLCTLVWFCARPHCILYYCFAPPVQSLGRTHSYLFFRKPSVSPATSTLFNPAIDPVPATDPASAIDRCNPAPVTGPVPVTRILSLSLIPDTDPAPATVNVTDPVHVTDHVPVADHVITSLILPLSLILSMILSLSLILSLILSMSLILALSLPLILSVIPSQQVMVCFRLRAQAPFQIYPHSIYIHAIIHVYRCAIHS